VVSLCVLTNDREGKVHIDFTADCGGNLDNHSKYKRSNMKKNPIAIYENPEGKIKVDVRIEEETLWLTQQQISDLFKRERSVITKHINNIFKEGELEEESVCAFFAHTGSDGKNYNIKYYNLDAILSVGYRVNSKQGTHFRKWASTVLKEYLVRGYSLNQDKLIGDKIKELQSMINLVSKTLTTNELVSDIGREVLGIIEKYSKTWDLLIRYDEDRLHNPLNLHIPKTEIISYDSAKGAISKFKTELNVGGLFGNEREGGLKSILGNLMQSFGGEYLYISLEERAAHLLYFIIKDHPFSDGNKRIGSLLFLLYLKMSGIVTEKMNENTITALALLVAESDPTQKEPIIKLIMNLIS